MEQMIRFVLLQGGSDAGERVGGLVFPDLRCSLMNKQIQKEPSEDGMLTRVCFICEERPKQTSLKHCITLKPSPVRIAVLCCHKHSPAMISQRTRAPPCGECREVQDIASSGYFCAVIDKLTL
ncbi:hypothetical protein HHUSO_G15262 [Huso huso]|uniref:Uncharacterized protein n=1 Tax=Huso huso TaxID=61971 RepID=A0ABR0ZGW9_HUSHU